MKCLNCEEEFEGSRYSNKFCSVRCRLAHQKDAKTCKPLTVNSLHVSEENISTVDREHLTEKERIELKLRIKRGIQAGCIPLGALTGDEKLFNNKRIHNVRELAAVASSLIASSDTGLMDRPTVFVLGEQ